MKIERYYYILLIFLICILSISAVSAADDTTSNTINTNIDDTIIDSADDTTSNTINTNIDDTIIDSGDEEIIDESSEETKLSESSENFISLDSKINGNQDEIVILEKDYAYDDSTDESYKEGINITRKVTIDGQNHTISGSNQARIFNISSSDVTIMNINFIKGNVSDSGGAILWNGDNGKLIGCNFTNNTANGMGEGGDTGDGGAIYWNGDNGKLTGCNFTQNQAGVGGAIYWNGDNGIVNNNTFTNNTALDGGAICWGGIYLKEYLGNNGTINNNTFIQNQAGQAGGAIDFISHNGTINNNTFTNNTARVGGAIYWQFGNQTTLNNNTFTNNTAKGGGAIYWYYGKQATINNNTFTNNTANGIGQGVEESDGGAIYWGYGDQATINNNTFTNNIVEHCGGGAIYWRSGDQATINNNTFTQNQAKGEYGNGAAIYWGYADQATINNNTFTQNQAKLDYGFVFYNEYHILNIKINNNIFLNNTGSGEIFIGNLEESNADYNWLGNTADNCTDTPRIYARFTTWLFLNATADPNTIEVFNSSEISFKLSVYNASNGEVSEYDNTLIPAAKMTTSATKGTVNNYAILGNSVEYIASELGTASVTAKIENIEYTINLINTITNPHLSVPSEEINYGENLIRLSYNEKATGTVNITLKGKNGNNYKFENLELKNAIKLPENILPDEYNISVEYSGDTNFYDANAKGKLTVKKIATKLTATKVTTTYNVNKNLIITLKDSKGNPISGAKLTVNLNGAKKYTTDKKGQVKIAVGKLVPKTYTVKISFAGTATFIASSTTAKVTVKKATPKLTAKAKSFKLKNKTKKYKVTLKDNKGNALKNKKVTLKVNGKTYTAKTNSKGVATFKLSKLTKKGTFTAVVTYKGNKYYKKVTKKPKVTVKAPAKKSTWKTVSKGSKDKATVKKIQRALKNNGYYLSYKGRYLKVDGIYHSCTVRSVKQFQKANNLKVTGKVDEKTAKKLKIY